MKTSEIIDGLNDLIKDREALIDENDDGIFSHDKEVLEAAVQMLTRNACYGCGYEHNCKDGHCAARDQLIQTGFLKGVDNQCVTSAPRQKQPY